MVYSLYFYCQNVGTIFQNSTQMKIRAMILLLFCVFVVSVSYGLDPRDWPDPPLWTDKPKTGKLEISHLHSTSVIAVKIIA